MCECSIGFVSDFIPLHIERLVLVQDQDQNTWSRESGTYMLQRTVLVGFTFNFVAYSFRITLHCQGV